MGLTVKGLAALKPGKWLSEDGNRGEGSLRAKGGPNGARFYFRHRTSSGAYDDFPIGSFDEAGKRGLSLAQARDRAKRLRDRYTAGEHDLRATLETEQREAERQRVAEGAAVEAAAAKQKATLGVLLTAYVAQLRKDGKKRPREVETALQLHVEKAWPLLWATPAESVTTEDCLAVVAKLVNEGKLRHAGKIRSYVRAAYGVAIRARHDAQMLPSLRELRLSVNPARDLAPIEGGSKARDRSLSVAELRSYWKRINKLPDPAGAVLRLHLLTGGQRIEQLSRLTVDDLDTDAESVRILDYKGRRKQPRFHEIPLIPAAHEALKAMSGGNAGTFLFTVTAGSKGVAYKTVHSYVQDVVMAMTSEGELEKGPFTPGDVRRTVETRLTAEGVSKDVRAHVQSHGLGGVQSRHYDKYEYIAEKREALNALYRLITGTSAKVTMLSKRSGKSR